ncbi:hypothetical protein GINT2_000121 [Glugoides intestinalis]
MAFEITNFQPFNSSLVLNLSFYIFLLLLNTHFSKSYLAQIAKRYPIKTSGSNIAMNAFIQCILASIPFMGCNLLYYTQKTEVIRSISYRSTLITSGLMLTLLGYKINKKVKVEKHNLVCFFILSSLSILPSFFFHENHILKLVLLVAILSCFLIILKVQFQNSYSSATEPSFAEVYNNGSFQLLEKILLPFEIVLENLFIIPDTKQKRYTVHPYSKVCFSTATLFLFSIYYYEKLQNRTLMISVGLILLTICTLFLVLYKRTNSQIILNLYNLLISLTILFYIFDQTLLVSKNLGKIFLLEKKLAIGLFATPLLCIQYISIQTSFIKSGFCKRTLYSLLYFPFVNLTITNFICLLSDWGMIESPLLNTPESKHILDRLLIFIVLTLFDIYRSGSKFCPNNRRLGAYTVLQELTLMSINAFYRKIV